MKKLVILKHGGGELANQLWNYISIYAYGLEIKALVRNPSFFEYHSLFKLLPKESWYTKILSSFFKTPRRRSHIVNRLGRSIYTITQKISLLFFGSCVWSSENKDNKAVYLPPTTALPNKFETCDTIYSTGWLFRNPEGITKFRQELVETFKPNKTITEKIYNIVEPLHRKYEKIIGVHIRQADYKIFKDGKYFIPQERVRVIIDEYIKELNLGTSKTVFIITSDGKIDEGLFRNLNVYISKESAVTDLFLLAQTNAIIGSDSSFGAFASWYGNIPQIILKKEAIDWSYYRDKTTHFDNKYLTLLSR